MNDWLPIIKQARTSLLVLAGVVIFSVLLHVGTVFLRNHVSAQLSQKQNQVAAEQENLATKQKDLESMKSSFGRFRDMQKRGVTGRTRREEWIEQLIASHRELRLPETLTYTLKQPSAVIPAGTPGQTGGENAGNDAPLAHDLEFELRSIHEEELLAFLKIYEGKVNGRFRVHACQLGEPSASGLAARCTLRFFTLPQNNGENAPNPIAAKAKP